ncbi:hypothetical protein Ddye_012706 [Dipteronia dyeriana]|uniref:Uncharacterized protein n=1 Tax=Dipteronia dyeriana TaxID=168575 RepID=A0AAD9X4X7_9ROSI|nr:hypothetical protein Ddye_012706 [Dipteronia dyeriana]
MEKDVVVPLLFGRPFLATRGALIDVQDGKLTLRVVSKKEEFNMFNVTKNPSQYETCCKVDASSSLNVETLSRENLKKPFEPCVVQSTIIKNGRGGHKPVLCGVMSKNQGLFWRERETNKVKGFWVRMFYASHKLRKEGGDYVAPFGDPD